MVQKLQEDAKLVRFSSKMANFDLEFDNRYFRQNKLFWSKKRFFFVEMVFFV